MNPIISGEEIVLPLSCNDVVTGARRDTKKIARPPVVPVAQPGPIDVWAAIARLNWVDRDDDQPPTANPKRPSQTWTHADWLGVQAGARPLRDRLFTHLDNQNFWFKNGIAAADQHPFVWHCIARGQQIYNAILGDTSFACGYIGQQCGFYEFITQWS